MDDKNKTTRKPAKTAAQKAKPTKKQIAGAVEKTKTKAEAYLRDPNKAKKLLDDAAKKTKGFEKNRGPLTKVWSYLTALYRLLRAYIHKEYRDIPWGSIVLVAVGILYFVSPIDLIPDVLPVIGYIDDAAVIAFVVKQIKADLDNFLAWEIIQTEDE
jgi:uncharacterized membrane protein YkvA (DUF1232 family)